MRFFYSRKKGRKMNEQKEPKRSCLYDIGWIKQKSEWLNDLKQFAGQSWVDVSAMNATLLRQIHDGTAFLNEDRSAADTKESAAIIRLKTGVYSDPQLTGEQAREVIIGFHRNQYDMWVGLDFDWDFLHSSFLLILELHLIYILLLFLG